MKSKQPYLLTFLVALLALPFFQVFADSPLSFEVVVTFDYPEQSQSFPVGINDYGEVTGFGTSGGPQFGFLRFRDHVSGAILEPNDGFGSTALLGINNARIVSGRYFGADSLFHSFLLSGKTFTELDIGIDNIAVYGINDSGNLSGWTVPGNPSFVVIDGKTTSFTIPGADRTYAFAINNRNQVAGYYVVGNIDYGFLRDADGTLLYPINASGAEGTLLYGINDLGWMVGYASDERSNHAMLFQSPAKQASYNYPGAIETEFTGINNRGLICGDYVDSIGRHGLIVRVRRAAIE